MLLGEISWEFRPMALISTDPVPRVYSERPTMFNDGAGLDDGWGIGRGAISSYVRRAVNHCDSPLILLPAEADDLEEDMSFAPSGIDSRRPIELYSSRNDRELKHVTIRQSR